VLVVLAGHEFVDELIRPLDYLTDLLDLLLLYLLITTAHLLVLAVLLHRPPQSVRQGVVRLLYRRVVEGKSQRFEGVHVGEDIDVFSCQHSCLLLVDILPDGLVEGVELEISKKLLLILEVVDDLREALLILLQ
jgi:hypothetical protein